MVVAAAAAAAGSFKNSFHDSNFMAYIRLVYDCNFSSIFICTRHNMQLEIRGSILIWLLISVYAKLNPQTAF